MRSFFSIFIFSAYLVACTPTVLVDKVPEILSFYTAPATEEWIPLVYNCADRMSDTVIAYTLSGADADISLGLIEAGDVKFPVYKIGEIELVIVSNMENSVLELTQMQVREIFEGKTHRWTQFDGNDAEIKLWVYGQEDDLQTVFNEIVLKGGTLSSLARQVANPKEMRGAIAGDSNAIGVLPRSYAGENFQIVHSIGYFSVLAVPMEKPQGNLLALLSCLQGE